MVIIHKSLSVNSVARNTVCYQDLIGRTHRHNQCIFHLTNMKWPQTCLLLAVFLHTYHTGCFLILTPQTPRPQLMLDATVRTPVLRPRVPVAPPLIVRPVSYVATITVPSREDHVIHYDHSSTCVLWVLHSLSCVMLYLSSDIRHMSLSIVICQLLYVLCHMPCIS